MKMHGPPKAKKIPHIMEKHNDVREDHYFWLRNKDNKEVLQYLKDENRYFEENMKPFDSLKTRLYKEMKARIKENDSTPPAPFGEFLYYTKFKEGQQYKIVCRRKKKSRKEEVILDCNKIAHHKEFFDSTGHKMSSDHQLIAYSADFDGSEKYQVKIKNIKTGKYFETLENCSGSCAWANDNETLFYVRLDLNLRPYQVYRHKLGENADKDTLIYEEKDSKHFIHLSKSKSDRFIFVNSHGKITSEVWYLEASEPDEKLICFETRKEGTEYELEHHEDDFLILTNYKAKNFQIMQRLTNKPGRKNWKTLIKASKDTLITSYHVFKDFLAISERCNGLPQIRVYNFKSQKPHRIEFKDAAYSVKVNSDNYEYATHILRITYSSPITPPAIFDYDVRSKKSKTMKVTKIKGHNPKHYRCKRVFVAGHDGVQIPLTLVYRKGLRANAKAPGYLYGYGSYGAIIPDAFFLFRDIYRLIDRGFVFGLAHVRGGSNMGRHWYENGKFLKKKNTFKDFISCAEFLGKSKLIDKQRLAIAGGSAGGMLVGACMNMRPDLFKAVVAHVPFVDVLNTMFDKDLPLTQMEFKEWGNPEDKKYYHYIKSYSPYDNVKNAHYPHLFVTCGLNDPRVTYWEPAKWVAKLRELKLGQNLILFKTNMGAGHQGASGRFEYLKEHAEEFAFLINLV
jgi:oligopeptidase B